ncbi:hypothetical protein IV203_029484 [Nitzschia inconspicua]|uniref:AB hydrolase-1 domain-containing protein n=1 Tax=Nitzschia inconspicua TaxID=303405 RepID=A0A9K3LQP8_9STRA|nr:hypothetical protein IV203_029484 [Nitzschia inconspicua]
MTGSRRSRRIPRNVALHDPGLSQKYFTRKHSSKISTNDLPMELNAIGFRSPWAFLWYFLFFVAPLVYIYIGLMLLRDLCEYFPETIQQPLQQYVPFLANLAKLMKSYYGFRLVDVWCVIEALFYIACKLKIRYLQGKDPLEASLSAAPMLDAEERKFLWDHMMDVDADLGWVSEWFLDCPPIESISRYDIFDFICWAMFDGRNQEHLTTQELQDLESFVEDLEYRIALQLYGAETASSSNLMNEDDINCKRNNMDDTSEEDDMGPGAGQRDRLNSDMATTSVSNNYLVGLGTNDEESQEFSSPIKITRQISYEESSAAGSGGDWTSLSTKRPRPKQSFRFREDVQREEPNYFSNLYESYKLRYDRYKAMVENADFHPVQDIRNLVAETAQQAAKTAQSAEETAMKSAQNMYETIVQPGSQMDKQLSALSHATSVQLAEAWNSVKGMKERLETANFLSERRKMVMQQLRGNRAMLARMREMSYAVNSKQMATLMRRITECYEALERTEVRARDAFLSATGKLTDNSLFSSQEPKRYAKYSSDPLLGIATYPLGFHLLMLGATEIPLRALMKRRGFERRCVGPVNYYYHPGKDPNFEDAEFSHVLGLPPRELRKKFPNVFIHGIGVGLIAYLPLIDALLESGRPLLLPEIPYVSAFRPWASPNAVLSPAVVASTMTAILAFHGFSKGTFIGHSYGTSWLSYVCKYSPGTVAALLFLDPICFCLHNPRLTTSFVYRRPDPGTIAFTIRTDMMVNWTIQRAFPWAWISLFLDQIHVPCTVFLGDKDALVPSEKVEEYFRANSVPVADAATVSEPFFEENNGDIKACIWRGGYHGIFTDTPDLIPGIAIACSCLGNLVEQRDSR